MSHRVLSKAVIHISYRDDDSCQLPVRKNKGRHRVHALCSPLNGGCFVQQTRPEGETCGLVKNLALLAHVTTDAEIETTKRSCYDLGVEQLGHLNGTALNSHATAYLVFLNGSVIGACSRPHKLAHALRRMRRSKRIGEHISVYTHSVHQAMAACDGGRVCRPLIVASRGRSRLLPQILEHKTSNVHIFRLALGQLTASGVVEYVDVNEEKQLFHSTG